MPAVSVPASRNLHVGCSHSEACKLINHQSMTSDDVRSVLSNRAGVPFNGRLLCDVNILGTTCVHVDVCWELRVIESINAQPTYLTIWHAAFDSDDDRRQLRLEVFAFLREFRIYMLKRRALLSVNNTVKVLINRGPTPRESEPRRLLETWRLLEHWPRAPWVR